MMKKINLKKEKRFRLLSANHSQKRKLVELVNSVHNEQKEIRFWASPDNQKAWETLLLSGTDLINTDNIEECRKFIIQKIYQKGHVDE